MKIERVEKFVPGGQALGGMEDGKKIFLWGVLPGEEVEEFRMMKKKSKYLEGVALRVRNFSEQRVEPRDECFLATSPWQILNYEFELEQKREIVKEVLRQEKVEIPDWVKIEETKTDGREYFYRNKMEYALYFDKEDEEIYLAFRERGSHRKIPLKAIKTRSEGCLSKSSISSLERPEIAEKALKIVQELNLRKANAWDYQSLLLRVNQKGDVHGGLFENRKPHPKFLELTDEILGVKYSYSPNGFFQINLPVYEEVLKEIKKEIKTEKVLDLYAGVGTIGLSVARERDLTLVEVDKAAYRELERNCRGMKTAKAVLAKSEEALEFIEAGETVILDPPRAGVDKKLVEKLNETEVEKIVYLSCNPATQARDVKRLEEKYEVERIVPFNFFPRTPHIENLMILKRR